MLTDSNEELEPTLSLRGAYCTIVAQNYLPQALTLYSSIREHEPDRDVIILVVDADRRELAEGRPRLQVVTTEVLGLPPREILDLATIYDVVEFSTCLKPLILKWMLGSYDQAVYLDPDTFIVSPLQEIEPLLDEFGIVLTPHFLQPIPPGNFYISEIHSLTVGIHNLGFCAVSRSALPFLEWWWSHLERECLIYPLLGLFVDQKWTDIGATLFHAHSLQHFGYNVGPWNLHERRFEGPERGWMMKPAGQSLRLFHFSGFDPLNPEAISSRLNINMKETPLGSRALSTLSRKYSDNLIQARRVLGPNLRYGFERDSRGKVIGKSTRRAYRKELVNRQDDRQIPSPFEPSEAAEFRKWKTRSFLSRAGLTMGDSALGLKYVFPDAYATIKERLPTQFSWVRRSLLGAARVRR